MMSEVINPDEVRKEEAITVNEDIRRRVTVGPPGAWVKVREVDEAYRHEGSHTILLYDMQRDASTGEDYYRVVQRLETMKALHELGQWRLDFDPRTQHVVIHSISVRREGSPAEHARPEKFRFLQREGGLEFHVIDGWITVVALLEDVRIGDVIDASYTIHTTHPFLPERSWLFTPVPSRTALRSFHLGVRFASGRAMQWRCNDKDFAPRVIEEEGVTEWSWEKEHVQAIEQEPNMPPWHFSGTWVQVTDCASWGEVAAGIHAAWQEDLAAPELVKMAEEIRASATTVPAQIERALTIVQDDIRYLSVNVDLGGQIPSSPGAVLRRRYGDCKDKSFLLSHLLRLLGVKACPVLVHTQLRQAVEELLPTPALFNHAIVQYEVEGQTRWVDPTLALQGGGALERLVPDFRSGLPVAPGVETLEKIFPLAETNQNYVLHETFGLDTRPGHVSILDVTIKATGWDAESLRRGVAGVGQEEVAKSREQYYRQMFPDIERVGALQWKDDREHNEFTLTESYNVKNAVRFEGKSCVFQYMTHHIRGLMGIPQAGARKNPYVLPYPCKVEHSIVVETSGLVGGRDVSPVMEKAAAFFLSADYKRKGNRAVVDYKFSTLKSVIAPGQFEAHKKAVNKIWPATVFIVPCPSGLPARQRRKPEVKSAQPSPYGPPSRTPAAIKKIPVYAGRKAEPEKPPAAYEPRPVHVRYRSRKSRSKGIWWYLLGAVLIIAFGFVLWWALI